MNTSWPASKATTLCAAMQARGYPVTRFGRMIISPLSEPIYLQVECLPSGTIDIDAGRRFVGPLTNRQHTAYVEGMCIDNTFGMLPIEIVDKIATYLVEKGLANV